MKPNIANILKKHGDSVPVDIVAIANELGVEVYGNDWTDSTAGMIKKVSQDRYAIYVNTRHPVVRQRFTVAHELAHFLLHKDHIGDGISEDALYRSGLQNWMEIEANQLAADLLMPMKHVLRYKKDPEYNTVQSIADVFRVSSDAMAIRLGIPN